MPSLFNMFAYENLLQPGGLIVILDAQALSFVETGTAPDQTGKFQKYAVIDTEAFIIHPRVPSASLTPAAAVDLAHLDDIIAEILDEVDEDVNVEYYIDTFVMKGNPAVSDTKLLVVEYIFL